MEKKCEVAEALDFASEWDYEQEKTEHEFELDEAARKLWESRTRAVRE